MLHYNSNNRSPYIANTQCNLVVKNALLNGYVKEDELQNINNVCKTQGGLNIFDKIYEHVKDGRFKSEDLIDIIQTPGGGAAVGSLLRSTLNILDILQQKINDGNLTPQEYTQFKYQIERQNLGRGSSTSNVDIEDIIGRLLLSAINKSVNGFPKLSQYQTGGKKKSKGSKKSSKMGSKKSSKKISKKGSKGGAKKTSKKGSKKPSKKGSKKSKKSKASKA